MHAARFLATALLGAALSAGLANAQTTLADNFDAGYDGGIWESVTQGDAATGDAFPNGGALHFTGCPFPEIRTATTVPLNVLHGATLRFDFRMGFSPEGNAGPPWDDSEIGEDVVVEFSTNGNTWIEFHRLVATRLEPDPDGPAAVGPVNPDAIVDWTTIELELPANARTLQTQIRLRQPNHNCHGDNWGVDNFELVINDPPPQADWDVRMLAGTVGEGFVSLEGDEVIIPHAIGLERLRFVAPADLASSSIDISNVSVFLDRPDGSFETLPAGTGSVSMDSDERTVFVDFVPSLTEPGIYSLNIAGVQTVSGATLVNMQRSVVVLPGDVDASLSVDANDLAAIQSSFGSAVNLGDAAEARRDGDLSGAVDLSDLAIVNANLGLAFE